MHAYRVQRATVSESKIIQLLCKHFGLDIRRKEKKNSIFHWPGPQSCGPHAFQDYKIDIVSVVVNLTSMCFAPTFFKYRLYLLFNCTEIVEVIKAIFKINFRFGTREIETRSLMSSAFIMNWTFYQFDVCRLHPIEFRRSGLGQDMPRWYSFDWMDQTVLDTPQTDQALFKRMIAGQTIESHINNVFRSITFQADDGASMLSRKVWCM